MADRIYEVAEMLKKAQKFRNNAPADSKEKDFFAKECYMWSKELLANNINPSDIYSSEFYLHHGI